MESWRCVSGENGFLSAEINASGDTLAGSKHSSFAWDSRNPCNFSTNLFSTHQQIQNQGFGGLGSLEMVGKQALNSSIFDALSSKAENGRIMNPITSYSTLFHRDESISKLSVSVAESTSRDSSLIDLKLGRFSNQWDAHCNNFSKNNQMFSSSESSTPSKRVRASPVNSQPAFCQVLGCNKDLSSSKDYHKRHKVCDIHSKTAKVIVNGIEQRFCQQCSRFHLLDAFDDGKRSCRKRLAGHNERRRKPQVGVISGRSGRLLPLYNGMIGSGFLAGGASFAGQEKWSNGLFLPDKYISNEWGRPIKVEEKHDDPLLTIPAIDGHLHSKTFFPTCDIETQFMPFTNGGMIFNEASSHYPSIGGLNSSSQSLCHNTSMGSDDFDVFDAASTVRSLPRVSDTGCALSLLSAQSRNSSSHSSGIPMARPWLVPIGQTHYNLNGVSEKLMGVSSTSGVSNKIRSSGEGCQIGPILTSDSSDTVNFEIFDRIFHSSSLSNDKVSLSSAIGPTIDLLQLSSQLQQVEHQRKSMQLKQENNPVCCLRIT